MLNLILLTLNHTKNSRKLRLRLFRDLGVRGNHNFKGSLGLLVGIGK